MLPLDAMPPEEDDLFGSTAPVTPASVIQVILKRLSSCQLLAHAFESDDDLHAAKVDFVRNLTQEGFCSEVQAVSKDQIRESETRARRIRKRRQKSGRVQILTRKHAQAVRRVALAKKDITNLPKFEEEEKALQQKLAQAKEVVKQREMRRKAIEKKKRKKKNTASSTRTNKKRKVYMRFSCDRFSCE